MAFTKFLHLAALGLSAALALSLPLHAGAPARTPILWGDDIGNQNISYYISAPDLTTVNGMSVYLMNSGGAVGYKIDLTDSSNALNPPAIDVSAPGSEPNPPARSARAPREMAGLRAVSDQHAKDFLSPRTYGTFPRLDGRLLAPCRPGFCFRNTSKNGWRRAENMLSSRHDENYPF